MRFFLIMTLIAMIQSCASNSTKNTYTNSKEYQSRKEIKKDYLKAEGETFSSKDIKNLLNQKINLKRPLKLAVVKLGHDNELSGAQVYQTRMYSFNRSRKNLMTKKSSKLFHEMTTKSKYIKDISLIPEFIMPEDQNFKNLRDVAALMQADLLLVLKTRSFTDHDFHLHKKNESKAIATIQAVVIDVKTGVIPFTSIATNQFLAKKSDKDYSNHELNERATLGAEDKALKELTEDLIAYFN